MTQHSSEQPKEYIIKESDMMEVCGILSLKGNPRLAQAFESVCRYRPHPVTTYPDRHEAYLEGLRDARLNADEAARKAREEFAREIHDMCECVPLKEYAPDYDRGFYQAMTLVRLWCTQQQAGEQHE